MWSIRWSLVTGSVTFKCRAYPLLRPNPPRSIHVTTIHVHDTVERPTSLQLNCSPSKLVAFTDTFSYVKIWDLPENVVFQETCHCIYPQVVSMVTSHPLCMSVGCEYDDKSSSVYMVYVSML